MTDLQCEKSRRRCQGIMGTILLLLWAALGVLLWRGVATETAVAAGKATREAQYESIKGSLEEIKRSLAHLKRGDLRAEPSP